MADPREALVALLHNEGDGGIWEHFDRKNSEAVADAILAKFDVTPRGVHNHDIDPACPETRLPDGSLRGACATDAAPPTVKPSVEDVARRHSRVSMDGTCICGAEGIGFVLGYGEHLVAETLALFPGRTEAEVYKEGYDQGLRDAASVSRSEAEVKAEALREAARAMRAAWEGSWNLRDPRDPEAAYSVDRWLEVSAARIEKGEGRG